MEESGSDEDARQLLPREQGEGGRKNRKKTKLEKLPYPKSIWFIVGNEFCERFSFYGMKAILSIYFKSKLRFSEDTATVVYHAFSMLCYFTPVFGAMLADQLLGKFRTIMWISLVYVLGHAIKTAAAIPALGLPPAAFSIVGLVLIALGTGGIKPCVSAFGGDQFKMPEQERQLSTFFLLFYFSINAGSLISTALTPILREDVGCFGDDTCYSLAFGVPAVLMLIATVVFVLGKPLYVIKPPQGNIATRVVGAIGVGLRKKFKSKEKKEHWLDHAKEEYGHDLVEDTKVLLGVLVLYCPIPVFWALFDQQGSRWTFQAQRANGMVGSYLIKPDQMQIVNPLMILIMLPLFDKIFYPLLARFNLLTKPLQRITVGGVLTAVAFFMSGFLELSLMETYEHLPKATEAHLHVMNMMECPVVVLQQQGADHHNHGIEAGSSKVIFELASEVEHSFEVRSSSQSDECTKFKGAKFSFASKGGSVTEVIVEAAKGGQIEVTEVPAKGDPKKADNSYPKVRFLLEYPDSAKSKIRLQDVAADGSGRSVGFIGSYGRLPETNYTEIAPATYDVWIDSVLLRTVRFVPGGVHSLVVTKRGSNGTFDLHDFLLTKGNSVHMLWLIPQYVVITAGEIMLSVTGLEFSYSQAPSSMKSVVQAAWLLTVAFGNVIVIIVAKSKAFDNQAAEFFMFGTLMLVDMVLFSLLAYRYKHVDRSSSSAGAGKKGEAMELEES